MVWELTKEWPFSKLYLYRPKSAHDIEGNVNIYKENWQKKKIFRENS